MCCVLVSSVTISRMNLLAVYIVSLPVPLSYAVLDVLMFVLSVGSIARSVDEAVVDIEIERSVLGEHVALSAEILKPSR